ncbi:MAG: hypothetical protein IT371_03170 [Deltaproteobacteria bacterium]|nr:hypothetical protein [Deltaproteobacteria bacterium]
MQLIRLACVGFCILAAACDGATTVYNGPADGGVDGTVDGSGGTRDGAQPGGDGIRPDGASPTDGAAPATDGTAPTGDGAQPGGDGPKPTGDGAAPGKDGAAPIPDGPKPTADGATPKLDAPTPTPDGPKPVVDAAPPTPDAPVTVRDSAAPAPDTVRIGPDASITWGEAGITVKAGQCSDGIDNDGDGRIDAQDPECSGPADNDESSYATGIPGDNMDGCKQDCFFDGNSGAGDDKCEWNLKCDKTGCPAVPNPQNCGPGALLPKPCPYNEAYATNPNGSINLNNCPATQKAECLQRCRRITPNGCDCFGCCAFPYNGGTVSVMLTATCNPSVLGDPVKCPRCTQVAACLNPCDRCEVCVGKPAPDPSCFNRTDAGTVVLKDSGTATGDGGAGTTDGGGGSAPCPFGWLYCGPGGIDPNQCPARTYCVTGCCVPTE